ncbi:TAXI family TRAP transporter solute-binding subunit [Methylobacterium oryzisoli]|uniref:TAXI family TRAP transporter solute-binding subunit n=1 Tax=Methylobacterium oryzisoli TaxID=3385502 RepID=UPI0038917DCB
MMRFLRAGVLLGVLLQADLAQAQFWRQEAGQSEAAAQPAPAAPAAPARRRPAAPQPSARDRMNAWTVGLAGGLLEGAPIRLAAEIARVVDDGDNLRVLPIVTRGPTENVQSLLHLNGVDAAIINADALEDFKASVPDIKRRVALLISLFPSELQVFVRPEIQSLKDLAGKKVNFNTAGTAAAYTGPLVLKRLGIAVEERFIPHQTALDQLRTGEIAGVVFVTAKPAEAFLKGRWEGGYKFLPVEYSESLSDYYVPAVLDAADYPGLIAAGEKVRTISVPTILVSYNWPRSSDRYRRVARLTTTLFDRIEALHAPGFHPKWKDVNLAAEAGQLVRFPAAQEWLDQRNGGAKAQAGEVRVARAQAEQAAPNDKAEQERLFKEFLEWRRRRP